MPPNSMYVGKPTAWANPFTFPFLSLDLSLALYREAVIGGWSPNLVKALTDEQVHIIYQAAERWKANLRAKFGREAIHFLAGQDLVCWCPLDQPCHVDILLVLLDS